MSTRTDRIQTILTDAFHPEALHILNESHQHHTHAIEETHFKVIVVSKAFQDLSRVKRHQAVYKTLNTEFESGLHALALHLYTPEEWVTQKEKILPTPKCRGGFDAD